MMIPKNSRNRRKHLSNHDSSTASSSQKLSAGKGLPTITRTSNHTSNHSSDRYSNSASLHDNDSACSWVELDFDQSAQEKKASKERKPTKPVSSVNINMDLVDDEESKSSATSNLSEDFTDKGDITKGTENGNRNNNDDDDSVTSFGSESFAQDVAFDDLLNESLMPSCSDLGAHMRKESMDELAEMSNKGINGNSKPISFRSDTKPTSERSKPTSERSKISSSSTPKAKKKSAKNHSSPKAKTRKKSKSPGAIQARKRMQKASENNNGESATNADESQKEHKKKSSRRRHGQVAPPTPPPPPPPTEEGETLIPLDDSSVKKRISPKPTKSSSSAASGSTTRRRRLRSSDSQDETSARMLENESFEPLLLAKDGSSRSLDAKPRKQERTRSKSKSKPRKTPSRSISNPDAAAAAAAKREVRKRYKKKASGHESDEDITTTNTATDTNHTATTTTKLRSASRSNREGKKKIRSKSTDDRKLGKNSDGRRRRKKRSSKQSSTDVAGATEEDTQKLLESPTPSTPKPDAEDEGEETDAPAQADEEPMENMTYSFHFRSDDDDRDKDEDGENWLNSANSSSSSLSYNSFAQFSLDVGDMSGLVTDMANLMGGPANGNNSVGIIPDLDASVQSFQTNLSGKGDASVVFMAGKSSKVSLLASSHSFDHGEDYDDGNGKSGRSARSVPTGSSDGILGKPEKQLRRRLKKIDGDSKSKDRTMINSEIKKKVRRAKSGGLERVKNSLLAGATRGGVERTKSSSEALVPGTSKLVVSSAKRQERQEKASRRKKEKSSSSSVSSGKPKHAGKSKSAHTRDLSASPQINFLSDKPTIKGDLFENAEMVYQERAISLNDVANDQMQSPLRTPKRSPRGREVRRTYSNPCPSPSIHAVGANSNHEFGDPLTISPMSYGSSPVSYNDNPKKVRRPSPSRQALLSSSNDTDSDEDYRSGADYSPHSAKKRSFLPKRGLERTPSSLIAGVRNHFKENPSNMLSKMKKTFSVSGRGKDAFDLGSEDISLGMATDKGYIGAKERRRLMAESAGRRGQVKNSLYACMSDSDSSVEISSEIFQDNDSDDDTGGRGNGKGPGSVASYTPTKADSSNRERSGPRRVNSLPIGIRRSPN